MEDDSKKKYFRRKNPFFDLFSDFDRMDEMMNELMGKSFKNFDKMKFGTVDKRKNMKMIWRRVVGKGFLTKREAFGLFGFFRKVK